MDKLFLDDYRDPIHCTQYMAQRGVNVSIYREKWATVRNYEQFVNHINQHGLPKLISFDHDLADEHYDDKMNVSAEEYEAAAQTFKEKTGFECAQWLINYCRTHSKPLPEFIIHSMNPVGRKKIEIELNAFKYEQQNG